MVQRGFDHDAEPANACWFLNALLARSDLGLYIIDHSVQESEVTCAGCMGDFQENPVRAVMSLPVPRTKSVPTLSTRAGSSRQFCEAFSGCRRRSRGPRAGAKAHCRITAPSCSDGGLLARHRAAALQCHAPRMVAGRSRVPPRVDPRRPGEGEARSRAAVGCCDRGVQRQLGEYARWVFPYCGGAIKQPTQAEWLSACKAAKLGEFHWHDLRHTWASWHVQPRRTTRCRNRPGAKPDT